MLNDRRPGAPLALLGVVLIAALLVLAPPAASATTAAPADDAALARDYIARINQERAGRGLNALTVLPELMTGAQEWTEHMAGDHVLAHDPDPISGLTTTNWDAYAENVGTGRDNDHLWDAFKASSGHYENIVNPMYTHVGVAVVTEANGRQWTTQRFLHESTPPPPGAEPLIFADTPAPPIVVDTTPATLPPMTVPVTVPPTLPPVTAPLTPPPTIAPVVTLPPVTTPPPPPPPEAVETPADAGRVGTLLVALRHLEN